MDPQYFGYPIETRKQPPIGDNYKFDKITRAPGDKRMQL